MAIYNNRMYFGNRNYMQWILAPKINYDASRRSRFTTAQYTNGGAFVRKSATGARGYNFSWDLKPRDEVRAIMDYADGVYGLEDAIYFLDPFAMDKNLLPQYWATPSLASKDAPPLIGMGDEKRPALIATTSNNLGYPTFSAQYTYGDTDLKASIYLPIPHGYSLWLGAHGTATGTAGLTAYKATGPSTEASDSVPIALLNEQTSTRLNTEINGDLYPGARITMTGAGTLTLSGVMAQILPHGAVVQAGAFISGQGHSGCSFNSDPVLTEYNAARDLVGLSVDLLETEGWK